MSSKQGEDFARHTIRQAVAEDIGTVAGMDGGQVIVGAPYWSRHAGEATVAVTVADAEDPWGSAVTVLTADQLDTLIAALTVARERLHAPEFLTPQPGRFH